MTRGYTLPTDLHFVCKLRENWSNLGGGQFETGNWHVAKNVADEATGGRIHLHETQGDPAWHGGTIVGWRPHPTEQGRLIFTYVVDGDFRVRRRDGWGQEKAIVRR